MEKTKLDNHQIVITGPESTGKTELAKALSAHYKCQWIPELARDHIESLGGKYSFNDVAEIANKQMDTFTAIFKSNEPTVFDTGLIITKVWFDVVFKKCPDSVIEFIKNQPKIPHLVCDVDLPWIPDSVRENGGEMRKVLFSTYINELKLYEFPYIVISGKGVNRVNNAIKAIDDLNIM